MLIKNSKGSVYVVPGFMKNGIERTFLARGFTVKSAMDEADYVAFPGGEDICPKLYGEKVLTNITYCNEHHDDEDLRAYEQATKGEKILLGICRGAQLFNVLNGGKMWQDINGHTSGPHSCKDVITGEVLTINSLHHQGMIVGDAGELVAYSRVSTKKVGEKSEWASERDTLQVEVDPEVIWYPNTRALCFQAHPEFGHEDTTEYFFKLIERYCPIAA